MIFASVRAIRAVIIVQVARLSPPTDVITKKGGGSVYGGKEISLRAFYEQNRVVLLRNERGVCP